MDVAIIADDLTGAADSGIQFVRAGYTTAVAFRDVYLPSSEGLDALAVDTDSRLLSAPEAEACMREAGRAVKDVPIVYKKIDSALRGPIAVELEAIFETTGRTRAIVAPAFPSTGRSTVGGVQLLHGVPVHETGLAADPPTPVKESHIPSLLTEAGLGHVSVLGTGDAENPRMVRQVLDNARWIVADAGDETHLKAIVEAVPDPADVLWVGSAGLARALSTVYPGPNAGSTFDVPPRQAHCVLVVIGSVSKVVREQLRTVARKAEVVCVPLDSSAIASGKVADEVQVTLASTRKALSNAHHTVLYTTVGENLDSSGAGRPMAAALANVVAKVSEEGLFDALVLTGGDTAVHVARALGARGILLEDEVETGVPVGSLIGPKPYPIVTKAGGFGTPDTLLKALQTLTV